MAAVDVESGHATVIPHSRLESIDAMSSSPSGRLFFSTDKGKILGYRPGSPRAALVARVGGGIYHLAAF
jgi:hypothetical protein